MDEKKQLDEQARAARAEYFRQWRAKNKGRVRESNRRYWQRRAERLAEEGGGGET